MPKTFRITVALQAAFFQFSSVCCRHCHSSSGFSLSQFFSFSSCNPRWTQLKSDQTCGASAVVRNVPGLFMLNIIINSKGNVC